MKKDNFWEFHLKNEKKGITFKKVTNLYFTYRFYNHLHQNRILQYWILSDKIHLQSNQGIRKDTLIPNQYNLSRYPKSFLKNEIIKWLIRYWKLKKINTCVSQNTFTFRTVIETGILITTITTIIPALLGIGEIITSFIPQKLWKNK